MQNNNYIDQLSEKKGKKDNVLSRAVVKRLTDRLQSKPFSIS